MAKIIYYENPINISDSKKFDYQGSIKSLLEKLKIENDPLAIRINGKSPDDIDLEYYVKDEDLIEIAYVVHGSSRRSKNIIGTILQISAIAVAFFFSGPLALASVVALTLAGSILQARAAKLIEQGVVPDFRAPEQEVNSNRLSISNATNSYRQNEPMNLVMGSFRLSPDFHRITWNVFDGQTYFVAPSPPSVDKEGRLASYHLFNFGLGDLDITDLRWSAIPIGDLFPQFLGEYAFSNSSNNYSQSANLTAFYPNVHAIDQKNLTNETDSYPETTTALNNLNKYNFVFIDSQKGPIKRILISAEIALFLSDAIDTTVNSVQIEAQYKKNTDTNYIDGFFPGTFNIPFQNYNTKKHRHTDGYGSLTGSDLCNSDQYLNVRIRKKERDSTNNDGKKVAEISVPFIYFFGDNLTSYRVPLNLMYLIVLDGLNASSKDASVNALVEPRCFVYDTDLDTWTWQKTRNPAWWFLYFCRGGFLNTSNTTSAVWPDSPTAQWTNNPENNNNSEIIFGAGLKLSEIDLENIYEWADFCDQHNLFFDYSFKTDISCADILETIAQSGRASVTYQKGKIGVIYEGPNQPVVGMFGMANILAGSFSIDYNVSDPVGKYIAQYPDRDDFWNSLTVEAIVPYAGSDNLKEVKVNLQGISERQQAQREVNLMAAIEYYQRRTYSWKSDQEGLLIKRGDIVYLSHDATQYSYSGRIVKFNVEGGIVTSIETTSTLEDSTINHVTIRYPDGNLSTYECTVNNNVINFVDTYPLNKAPVFIDTETDNNFSDYTNSMPDDFIFIAAAKETPGKRVRITERTASEDGTFSFKAVDDDPAMWSYEFNDLYMTPPIDESFDDSEIVCKIDNLQYFNLGNGLVKIMWENLNSHYIKIVNNDTELPIEADGSFAFSGGEVILELDPGYKYNLRIEPFVVGTPYRQENKVITVWA